MSVYICKICGKERGQYDFYTTDGGEKMCYECYRKLFYTCGCCCYTFDSRKLPKSKKTFGLNQPLCPQCAKYIVRKCSCCGHENNHFVKDEDGQEYCRTCVDNAIHGYHHSQSAFPFFAGRSDGRNYKSKRNANGSKYIGLELEMDQDIENADNNYRITLINAKKMLKNEVYFEQDCSLGHNGAELIIYPHTIQAFCNMPWRETLEFLVKKKYRSHNSGKCGLHMHINKAFFGKTKAQQVENWAKILVFYDLFWDDIVKFSRRTNDQLNHWANRPYLSLNNEQRLDKKKMEDNAKRVAGGTCGRYSAVNLRSDSAETIEFRAMRGTLNYSTFMATVDFNLNIVQKSTELSWEQVFDSANWLKDITQNTKDYMKKRKCFGYTQDETQDEEVDS